MKAMLVNDKKDLKWSDVPKLQIKADEVLVKVFAAAVNRADLLQREGNYPPPIGCPEWLGLEISGVICEVGEQVKAQDKWHIGDKVCALMGGGGYAEYAAVQSGMVMPIPQGLTMTEAAALPEAFGASYLFLFWEGNLKKGDTVLVTAGASGLASVLIPMAKAAGARVITTVISEEMAQSIVHIPADMIINTNQNKLEDVLKSELESGRGVDIVIDCLGGDSVGKCLPYMNFWGRWIIIASLAGDTSTIDLKHTYVRRTRIIGTTLRSRTLQEKARILDEMTHKLWEDVSAGKIRPTIHKTYPIEQAEEAHALMRSGKSAGKLVLIVSQEACHQ